MDLVEIAKENYRFYIQIMLIFAFLLSICYLVGYWTTFDVNIFPFLTISDLLKSAAYPLILFIPLQLLQILLSELHVIPVLEKYIKKLKNGEDHYENKFFRRETLIIGLIFVCFFVGIWRKLTSLWFGVPLEMAIFWAFIKDHKVKNVSQEARIMRLLIVFGLLPFIAFDYGKWNAMTIINDSEYSYSFIKVNTKQIKLKYLGFINDHYFFMDMDNKQFIIEKDFEQLVLKKYLKKNEKNNSAIGFT